MIYAGFSQGATLAGDYLIAHAAQFPIAALAEGGYDYLSNGSFGTRYFGAGGRRLLLVCGTPGCLVTANRAAINLRRVGLEVTVLSDMNSGHGIGIALQKDIRQHWDQLVAGVDSWERFPQHRWPKEW
jgi:predicted esterase